MVNLNNYILCLVAGDMKSNDTLDALFKEIRLDKDVSNEIKVKFWINSFEQRMMDLEYEYVHMLKYYNKIDCYDLFSTSAKNSSDRDKDLANHYWYNYHMTSVVTRCLSVIDNLYQLINEKYELKVENKPGFQNKIISKLKRKNGRLNKCLSEFKNEQAVKQMIELRNTVVHIYTPINNKELNTKLNDWNLSADKTKLIIDDFLRLLNNNFGEIKIFLESK